MAQVCAEFEGQDLSLNGLLSLAHFKGERFQGYNGYSLRTGEVFPLIRIQGEPEWERIGRFYFLPEGMKQAEAAILEIETSRLTVIDEMGPHELTGKGFWEPFLRLQELGQPTLLVVRAELLDSFLSKIQSKPHVLRMAQPGIAKILKTRIRASLA